MVYFCSPKFFSPSSVKPFFPTQKRAPVRKLFSKSFSPAPHFSHRRRFLFLHSILCSSISIFARSVLFSCLPVRFPSDPPAAGPLFFPPDACNQKKGMLRPSAACKFFTSPDDTGIPYAPHPPDPRRLYGRHPSDAISASHRVCRGSRLWTLFRRLKRPV